MFTLEVYKEIESNKSISIFSYETQLLYVLHDILWQNRYDWEDDPDINWIIWNKGSAYEVKERDFDV